MSDGELTPLSDEESEATPSPAKRKVDRIVLSILLKTFILT